MLLFFEHAVDSCVEQATITIDIQRAGIRFTGEFVEPPVIVGFFNQLGERGRQSRIATRELPGADTINVADGLESFDRAEDVARLDRRSVRALKPNIHQLTEHSQRELCVTHPPPVPARIIARPRQPAVRVSVEMGFGQMGYKCCPFVKNRGRHDAAKLLAGTRTVQASIPESSPVARLSARLGAVHYFDHNATSPLSATARAAWLDAVERFPANPSSPHRLGARADAALTEARQAAADWLGCSPFDLVWTGGATEANNAVFHHAGQAAQGEAWVSAIEHPSVLAAVRKWFGNRARFIPVTPDGIVDLNWLAGQLSRQRPALVALMAANNEAGVLQPWREALAICRRHAVPFACDAAQWIGKLPAAGLGECDFVTGCAHKFGGPPGVGFMKVPAGFRPLIVGGPQEDGRRAGTENLPGILAMTAAWAERERQLAAGQARVREGWRDQFISELRAAVPEIEVLGEGIPRLWNTVAASMPPTEDCRRRWVVQLDKLGFAVSTGSACASGKDQPSHVLLAMGGDPSKADRMLRFSAGWETTAEDWRHLQMAVQDAWGNLKSVAAGQP